MTRTEYRLKVTVAQHLSSSALIQSLDFERAEMFYVLNKGQPIELQGLWSAEGSEFALTIWRCVLKTRNFLVSMKRECTEGRKRKTLQTLAETAANF